MSRNRPVLKQLKAPKGDIDAMLQFIQEQKSKPSDAQNAAKKLAKISSDQKNREKKNQLSKSYMNEFRSLIKQTENSKNLLVSSLMELSASLPELPSLLKMDAKLQNDTNIEMEKCVSCIERLQHLLKFEKSEKNSATFQEIHNEAVELFKTLELPESYDNIVEIVNKTKLPPPEKQQVDLSVFHDEWVTKASDLVAAFAQVEKELKESNRKWMIENNFDPDVKYGGWDNLEHQRFLLTGCGEITVEFGDKTNEEIIRHKKWYIKHQYMMKKIDALRAELKTRIERLKIEMMNDDAEKEDQRVKQQLAEERQRALAEEKAILDDRLKLGREEKQKRDAILAEKEEQERLIREAESEKRKQRYDKELKELKIKVNNEKERRKVYDELLMQRKLKDAKKERELFKMRRKEMVAAVSERKAIDDKKKARKAEEMQAERDREIEKVHRLELLAQQVRDEFGLDNVTSDPTKLTKIHELRRMMDPEPKPMFNQISFASSVIEQDPRIRIENALREAGLINSPYAINVINQMSAIRPTPNMSSSIF